MLIWCLLNCNSETKLYMKGLGFFNNICSCKWGGAWELRAQVQDREPRSLPPCSCDAAASTKALPFSWHRHNSTTLQLLLGLMCFGSKQKGLHWRQILELDCRNQTLTRLGLFQVFPIPPPSSLNSPPTAACGPWEVDSPGNHCPSFRF